MAFCERIEFIATRNLTESFFYKPDSSSLKVIERSFSNREEC